jgi:hypothetical protein
MAGSQEPFALLQRMQRAEVPRRLPRNEETVYASEGRVAVPSVISLC